LGRAGPACEHALPRKRDANAPRVEDEASGALVVGLTFDTGALIGLERARHLMRKVYGTAILNDVRITVPAVVVAEWWRTGAKEKERAQVLRSVVVEPTTEVVARMAGAALTLLRTAQTIDALVMASAAQRPHEIVYTSDPGDLEMLKAAVPQFASIQILRA